METDGRRMCEVLVGLGEVDLVGVEELAGDRLRVTIRSRGPRPVRLRWKKRRWVFPNPGCGCGVVLRSRTCQWRRNGAC